MPTKGDHEEYLTIAEARKYLGGISSQTLRLRARDNHVQAYKQGITKKIGYAEVVVFEGTLPGDSSLTIRVDGQLSTKRPSTRR